MRVIRSSDYRRMRWKNGGGETAEIAVWPQGASIERFDWRISMAHVETPGPFSIFPEVDRTLSVIDGRGLELRFSGERTPVRLTRSSDPYAFPADAAVEAALIEGPVTDLNVMTRRDRARHVVHRLALPSAASLPCKGDWTLLFVHEGNVEVRCGPAGAALASGDTALLDGGSRTIVIEPEKSAAIFVIEIRAQ